MKFCWSGAQVYMVGMGLTALMVLMGTERGSEPEEVTWVLLMTAWCGGASTEHTHTGPIPITVWSSCSSNSVSDINVDVRSMELKLCFVNSNDLKEKTGI